MKTYIVDRSQHSRGGGPGHFGGPDRYVAVVRVPDGAHFDPTRTPLNQKWMSQKGIRFTHVGEYYSRHTGPRSMYAAAMAAAKQQAETRV